MALANIFGDGVTFLGIARLSGDFWCWFCNLAAQMARMQDKPRVYGCVGAEGPEAQPFIEEFDGIRMYTCPTELAADRFKRFWFD